MILYYVCFFITWSFFICLWFVRATPVTLPSSPTNSSSILYRTGPKTNLSCHVMCLSYVLISESMNISASSTLKQVKKSFFVTLLSSSIYAIINNIKWIYCIFFPYFKSYPPQSSATLYTCHMFSVKSVCNWKQSLPTFV